MKLQEQTMMEATLDSLPAKVHARNRWRNTEISKLVPSSLFRMLDDIDRDHLPSGSIACEQGLVVAEGIHSNEIADSSLQRKLEDENLWTLFNKTLQIADDGNSSNSPVNAHTKAGDGDDESGGPPLKTVFIQGPASCINHNYRSQKSSGSMRDITERSHHASASSFGSHGRRRKRRLAFGHKLKSATGVLDVASFQESSHQSYFSFTEDNVAKEATRNARWAPISTGGRTKSSFRSLLSTPIRSRSPGHGHKKKATALFSSDTGRCSTSSLPIFPDLCGTTAMTRWEPIVSLSNHL